MKSKGIHQLMRVLVTLVGAGIGLAISMGIMRLYRASDATQGFSFGQLTCIYVGTCLFFGVITFLASNRILQLIMSTTGYVLRKLDGMPIVQLVSALVGLTLGLVIAALITDILQFLGDSMFTTALCASLFVLLGLIGYTVGYRRATDVDTALSRLFARKRYKAPKGKRRHARASSAPTATMLIDTSALIDGRILDIQKIGFLEGTFLLPAFVLNELRQIADASDPLRRTKGNRGLSILEKLQAAGRIQLTDTDFQDTEDGDVKLLRISKQLDIPVVTGDNNLSRAAAIAGLKTLNINHLANALKPALLPGDELTVSLIKEGREATQAVAYLEDGTMVVVEGARDRIGQSLSVTVTSALQTNAGRMIFAKPVA